MIKHTSLITIIYTHILTICDISNIYTNLIPEVFTSTETQYLLCVSGRGGGGGFEYQVAHPILVSSTKYHHAADGGQLAGIRVRK